MSHVAWSVRLCVRVCVSDTHVNCAKTAEPIEMPFGGLTDVGPRNHVLHGDTDPEARVTFEGRCAGQL